MDLDILSLLDSKGIEYEQQGESDEFSITCLAQHLHQNGVDNHKSLNVNIAKGVARCNACGFAFNQAGLHKWLLGEDLDELMLKGMEIKGILNRLTENTEPLIEQDVEFFYPVGDPIDFDYRGISKEFYLELGGTVPKRGRYADRLCFPILLNGKLIGVDGRTLLPDVQPRYLRNKGAAAATTWLSFYDYNKELINKIGSKFIILAEGMFHSIRPLSFGIPATCYFGALNMTEHKVMLLLALGVEEVVIFPDLDEAGYTAQIEITKLLAPWFKVTWPDTSQIPIDEIATLSKGKTVYKDLGDLSKEEIEWALQYKRVVKYNAVRY